MTVATVARAARPTRARTGARRTPRTAVPEVSSGVVPEVATDEPSVPAGPPRQRAQTNPADALSRVPDGPRFRVGGVGTNLAGAAVALIFWGWVALPFISPPKGRGRVQAVQDVLRAKLTNRGPDGQELP